MLRRSTGRRFPVLVMKATLYAVTQRAFFKAYSSTLQMSWPLERANHQLIHGTSLLTTFYCVMTNFDPIDKPPPTLEWSVATVEVTPLLQNDILESRLSIHYWSQRTTLCAYRSTCWWRTVTMFQKFATSSYPILLMAVQCLCDTLRRECIGWLI